MLKGYGPSNQWQNLMFNGNERNFKLWKTKILGYIKVSKLKDILVGNREVDEDLNVLAFTELIQFLHEHSLSLFICDAKDNGREAFKILGQLYSRCSKPKIITQLLIRSYHQ